MKHSTRHQEVVKLSGGRSFFQSSEREEGEKKKKTWQTRWFDYHTLPWSVGGKLIPTRKLKSASNIWHASI